MVELRYQNFYSERDNCSCNIKEKSGHHACSDFSSVCVYVLKGKRFGNKEKIELKRLRVTMVTKALFIFIGIILMQLIAYMLCVLGYTVFGIAQGIGYARALAEITILNTTKSTNLMLTISAVSAILSFIWCAILYKKSGFQSR